MTGYAIYQCLDCGITFSQKDRNDELAKCPSPCHKNRKTRTIFIELTG